MTEHAGDLAGRLEGLDQWIKETLRDYVEGGPDKTAECLKLGAGLDWVPDLVARAREARGEWEGAMAVREAAEERYFAAKAAKAAEEEAEKRALFISLEAQPRVESERRDGGYGPGAGGGMAERLVAALTAKKAAPAVEEPKKLAERQLAAAVKVKPKPKPKWEALRPEALRTRLWSEVTIPNGVSEIEALTYVPGLVGDIVGWIVAGARRPNRVMALGVALAVVGTLIGRRVEGPTGSATHLYIFILADSGWGKDHPLWCGNKLLIAVGAKDLLGPQELISGRGFIKYLKRRNLMVCFIDELGDLFNLINGQENNPWVRDVMGHLKKLYNAWSVIITGETVADESVVINHPAVSIVGACTPQSFFETIKIRDVEGGFANRPLILPFEGFRRPAERDVPEGMEEPPAELIEGLKRLLPEKKPILDRKPGEIVKPGEEPPPAPPVAAADRSKLDWGGEDAKRAYFTFSGEMDQWEEKDRRKFQLAMRTSENAIRCATNVAAGCFSPTVDVGDIAWAVKWARVSFEAADGGLRKYMRDYFEFPKFCEEVVEAIAGAGGWISDRELRRRFRPHMKYGNELDKALSQLQHEGRLRAGTRSKSRGPAAVGWEGLKDAEG